MGVERLQALVENYPGDFLRFPATYTVPRFGGKDAANLTPASTTGYHGDVAHCCLHGFGRPGVPLWQEQGAFWWGSLNSHFPRHEPCFFFCLVSLLGCPSSDWPFLPSAIFSPRRERQYLMREVLSLYIFLRLRSEGFQKIGVHTFRVCYSTTVFSGWCPA